MRTLNAHESKRMDEQTRTSQWYFNPLLLPIYDFFVYRFISQFIWGCSNELLINRYKQYVTKNHLEVGVGTGYLLDNIKLDNISLDLMDLSKTCLHQSRKRLSRYAPNIIKHNILEEPIEEDKRYSSIGINYVMHCVAGDYINKGIVFDHLKMLLKDNGVIFGTTVIKTQHSSGLARLSMKFLNYIGIFNNRNDKVEELKDALEQQFKYVNVELESSVALFVMSDDRSRL